MLQKISVVINTYNAERYLEEVLNALKAFDEVVICDMESMDSTLEIARRFGCKIVHYPKGNHKICEPARNFAIQSATNDWVLVVDADEVVPAQLRDYLYQTISDEKFDGALALPRKNRFMGREVHSSSDYQLRFFRKDRAEWPPIIHARPIIDGVVKNVPSKKELSLKHLDDPRLSERITKINVYSDYEVPKRKNKNYGIFSMILRPLWFFIKSYIIGGGFRDGKRGVINAYIASIYQIMLLSKLYEEKLRNHPNS